MSSRPRRSTMKKVDYKEQTDDIPRTKTRSRLPSSSNLPVESHCKGINMKKKDIQKDLNNIDTDDSEIYNPQTGKDDNSCNYERGEKSIIIRIEKSIVDYKCKLILGTKDKYNKVEMPKTIDTPRSMHKDKIENRKRLAKGKKDTGDISEGKSDSDVTEVNENNMSNANSPSKRSKSDSSHKTPHKCNMQNRMTGTKLADKFSSKLNIKDHTPKSVKKNLDFCESHSKSSNTPRSTKTLNDASHKSNTRKSINIPSTPLNEISTESNNIERYRLRKRLQGRTYFYQEDEEQVTSGSECEIEEETESSDEDMSDAESNDSQSPKRQKTGKKNFNTPKKQSVEAISRTPRTPIVATKISMDTPTKAFSRMSLTPSFHQRSATIAKPSTPLQEARLKLHVSVLPKSLPCREEQFNDIYTFLHARLADKSGGCIYISGVPGTGKTATVNEVIRCLKKAMAGKKLTEFDYVDVNGMKLSEPRQAYVQIWKQLEKDVPTKTITWEAAYKVLNERFSKPNSKRKMTLLLVDELDLLCTKRQDVVYNILDWPSKIGAKLVVVTIANTMDLPERILMGKVTSRLGLTRLTFPPYNHRQLEEIVVSRLKGHNAFGGETIQLVARKVAAVSGDARRALDICRRATEVAEASDREIVSMIDVKKALDEMIASPKIQAIKHCSDYERIFLQAVCTEVNRTGVEEVVFKNVYHQLETLCTFNGEKAPNITEALDMCSRLGSWRLLLCDHSRMDIHQRLLLNVTTDDVHFALQAIETY